MTEFEAAAIEEMGEDPRLLMKALCNVAAARRVRAGAASQHVASSSGFRRNTVANFLFLNQVVRRSRNSS